MSVTAFLGAYGYGNLGDELCLIEAMQRFPGGSAFALGPDPDWTMRVVPGLTGGFQTPAEMLALKPTRIIFGGGLVGRVSTFRTWLPAIATAMEGGAVVHFNNLGIDAAIADEAWADAAARAVLCAAESFTVRDPPAFEVVARAAFGRLPGITWFPEADLPPDSSLADALLPPAGRPILGVSIIGNPTMRAAVAADPGRIEAALAPFRGHALLPIISTRHRYSAEENDAAGTAAFIARFLPGQAILAPELLDLGFWRAEVTPPRLKGLIARCTWLVTQRKHNAVHAIGAGVPVLGMTRRANQGLRHAMMALGSRLAPGSRYLALAD